MATEGNAKIGDCAPICELVDCTPAPEPQVLSVNVSAPVDASPVRQAMDNTITQTGADPPPAGDQ